MLLLLGTGGFLLSGRKVRHLLNDESARANRVAAQAVGFWATILALIAVYMKSMFDPVTLNRAVHIVGTIGVGAGSASRARAAGAPAWLSGSPIVCAEREFRGWTQAELAARVGVSRKTINTVENGIFVPSTMIALKIAQAFERPVEQLFSVVDESS